MSEQVNVMVVSGHTVTCPSSDFTDDERTIPLAAIDKTAICNDYYSKALKPHSYLVESYTVKEGKPLRYPEEDEIERFNLHNNS